MHEYLFLASLLRVCNIFSDEKTWFSFPSKSHFPKYLGSFIKDTACNKSLFFVGITCNTYM